MHTKAAFIEDEMVSLWPPTAPSRCTDQSQMLVCQMQISEFRVKQRTDNQTDDGGIC